MCDHPRFVVDVMLGSLAKWLRMLGFDALYFRHISDNELIRLALQEHRILLTRDRALSRSRRARGALLIESDDLREQLKQALRPLVVPDSPGGALPLAGLPFRPRCPRCNGVLSAEAGEAVRSEVPEHVLLSQRAFFRCGPCGKVYWEGSHKRLIDKTIMSLLKEIGVPGDKT